MRDGERKQVNRKKKRQERRQEEKKGERGVDKRGNRQIKIPLH